MGLSSLIPEEGFGWSNCQGLLGGSPHSLVAAATLLMIRQAGGLSPDHVAGWGCVFLSFLIFPLPPSSFLPFLLPSLPCFYFYMERGKLLTPWVGQFFTELDCPVHTTLVPHSPALDASGTLECLRALPCSPEWTAECAHCRSFPSFSPADLPCYPSAGVE